MPTTIPVGVTVAPPATTAKMTFDDEFNTLSLSTGGSNGGGAWQPAYFWSPNGYASSDSSGWMVNPLYGPTSAADANPYSISNGNLNITVKPRPADVSAAAVANNPYLAGQLTTHDSFSQQYGYFEMRAQMPTTPGINAAFWLIPETGAWPPEIDIEEVLSRDPTTVFTSAWSKQTGANVVTQQWNTIANTSQGFHTYAVDWEADHITYYLDNKQVYQINTPADAHQPMYVILDASPGKSGSWQGFYAPDGQSSTMTVDYVRVWDQNPYTHPAATQPPVTQPPVTQPPAGQSASPDGTVVTNGSGKSIIDAQGNVWTVAGGVVAENGVPAGYSANVVEIAYVKSAVWQENTAGNWWSWNNGGWSAGTNPLPASPPVTQPPASAPSSTIELRMSEDAYQGDAQFIVKVDGKQVGGTYTVNALHASGMSENFDLQGGWDATQAHTVQISFLNDAYGGTSATDRNLYVSSVAINGKTQAGSTANLYRASDATVTVGGPTAQVAEPKQTIGVHLAGDAYQGQAQFRLLIDGKAVTTAAAVSAAHDAGQWQTLTFAANLAAGAHDLGVEFLNPVNGATSSTSRTLYVKGVDVNDAHYGADSVVTMHADTVTHFAFSTQ